MLSYSEQLSLQLHGYPGPGPGLVVAAPRLASLFSRPGPPDVTQQLAEYQEWLEREKEEAGRVEYVYEHNLLDHVGEVSSFDVRPERRRWPKCHQPLADAWSLGGIERFDRRACGHSDVSPCPRPTDPERWNGTSSLG